MSRARTLLTIGILAYVVAWFLPITVGGTTLAQGGLPGWEAFRIALGALWPSTTSADSWWSGALATLSALTNFLLLGAVYLLLRAKAPPSRFLTRALFAAAILNTWWFVFSETRADLRPGYYLWALSFFLIAVASGTQRSAGAQPSGAAA